MCNGDGGEVHVVFHQLLVATAAHEVRRACLHTRWSFYVVCTARPHTLRGWPCRILL